MELKLYEEITGKLQKTLHYPRYVHSLGVAYTAAALAMKYEIDVDKALLAGLLHDCAKYFSDEDQIRLCREGNVSLTQTETENPKLIHAKLGTYIAVRDYGVGDAQILKAIESHTTGQPDMTMLQKIIYLADMLEPTRQKNIIPHLDEMRTLAFEDIDECIYKVTKNQLQFLESKGKGKVDPMTRETYYYYKDIYERKHGIR